MNEKCLLFKNLISVERAIHSFLGAVSSLQQNYSFNREVFLLLRLNYIIGNNYLQGIYKTPYAHQKRLLQLNL
jgi:hypothetical protein